MRRGCSVYLDLVRVIACLIVFGHHMALIFGCYEPTGNGCKALGWLIPFHAGHSAVVIFFVLSGYVITYVASERETTLRDYAISRCARIYAVAVPALLLTIVLDAFFMANGDYSGIPLYQYRGLWKYVPLSLTFTTDHWFFAENAFSHGGWWSLSYEVWCYIVFAAAFYTRGWRRWVATILVLLFIGPKLWALLLCWLMGYLVYRLHGRAHMTPRLAMAVVIGTVSAIVVIMQRDVLPGIDQWADAASGGWLATNMRFSQWFVGDILLASLFATSVFAAKFAPLNFGFWASPIKYLASVTFTLYMIHGLIVKLCVKYFDLGMLPTVVVVTAFTFVFASVTEHQTGRLRHLLSAALSTVTEWWRRWFGVALQGR